MTPPIRRAAVLGAGLMGAQIAALLAGAGVDVHLLDLADPAGDPAGLARRGLERLRSLRPQPFYAAADLRRIEVGSLEQDLSAAAAKADWIIEAIVEDAEAKRALLARLDPVCREGVPVSTNTSGLSLASLVDGRGKRLRRHFLGTHFFNPPRAMKLLEVIPGPETDPAVLRRMVAFAEQRLGKGVVVAKDTPNFIANRLGCYSLQVTLAAMAAQGLSVEAVDALTGRVLGRPKSATFRTLDVVGLDTYCQVVDNMRQRSQDEDERRVFTVPPALRAMIDRGWVGVKAGQGFYRKRGGLVEVLDLDTLAYRRLEPEPVAGLEALLGLPLEERVAALLALPDPAGAFVQTVLLHTLAYAARVQPEIASSPEDIDRAMVWGFGWEQGPFALCQRLGMNRLMPHCRRLGLTVPSWLCEKPGQPLSTERTAAAYHWQTAVATLEQAEEGIAVLWLHGDKSTLGQESVEALRRATAALEQGETEALVIASRGRDFSLGANLAQILFAAQEEAWDQLEVHVRAFQEVLLAIKYAPGPVVAAVRGRALGGGAELLLHVQRVVAAPETYLGLVETGAGLIPAGGGSRELLLHLLPPALQETPGSTGFGLPPLDVRPFVGAAFETIGFSKVAGSAFEARQLGFLRPADAIVWQEEALLPSALATARALLTQRYTPPAPMRVPALGEAGFALLATGLQHLRRSGQASAHDERIGRALARVLTGGAAPEGSWVAEAYGNELEREAFLSLCGEPLSQARMAHLLRTGNPLRN